MYFVVHGALSKTQAVVDTFHYGIEGIVGGGRALRFENDRRAVVTAAACEQRNQK